MKHTLNHVSLKWPLTALLFLLPLLVSSLVAEAQVTSNILMRVFMIKVGQEQGTAFTIERHQKQFLITAAHIVAGLPDAGATIQLRQNGDWRQLRVDIIRCDNPAVDIAVLKIPAPLSATFPIEAELAGVMLGQEVYFLGYPYGIFTIINANGYPLPLVKRGIISAIGGSDKTGVILYVDGFNNPGFSGGPIVVYDHFPDKLKVIGVVSGYWNQADQVRFGQNSTQLTVLSNSGILVGYSIQHATEAIDKFEQSKEQQISK